jgi:hypothetical protein
LLKKLLRKNCSLLRWPIVYWLANNNTPALSAAYV